ncbi:hypothetical protein [uncultured Psychrobacter sp.]|uniref:hypothetical protein n=1 Tax=uncultured Psychrobacter sp. TaxID=259303 RepID=UPI0034578C84
MKNPNDKQSTDVKRKLNKRRKSEDSLPLATWILLIISFSLLAYALYSIQTRIVQASDKTDITKSSLTQAQ